MQSLATESRRPRYQADSTAGAACPLPKIAERRPFGCVGALGLNGSSNVPPILLVTLYYTRERVVSKVIRVVAQRRMFEPLSQGRVSFAPCKSLSSALSSAGETLFTQLFQGETSWSPSDCCHLVCQMYPPLMCWIPSSLPQPQAPDEHFCYIFVGACSSLPSKVGHHAGRTSSSVATFVSKAAESLFRKPCIRLNILDSG